MIKKFPIIYKRNENGNINQWQIIVLNNTFYTIEGVKDGKLTTSKPTICYCKNVGKTNYTQDNEQALKEASAKWTKKIEKGYKKNIKDIDNKLSYHKCMLAHKYLDYKDKLKFPLLVSPKIDGLRMICTKSGLTTRNGKPFASCPHIHAVLKPLFDKHPNWVIDGEIYSTEVPFEKIVSLTRKKKPTAEDISESAKICQLWIFDGVIDNKNETFVKRFEIITTEIEKVIGNSKSLKFVNNIEVNSHDEIEKHHDEFVKQNYEGIMIRIPDSSYENKRSKNLLKLKNFIDEEATIVDVVEGLGNRANMAGNLDIKLEDGRTCSCGIKGDENFYRELLINKKAYIGKTVTIRYQNLTEKNLPRFPVAVVIDPIDR